MATAAPTILTDTALVARFKKGCEFSFQELIGRYETKAHNLAMRLTRNPEDAEEVLQDVFVTVYRKIDSFEGKAKFSSWLYRITVNAAFMKLRKRKQDTALYIEDLALTSSKDSSFEKSLTVLPSDTRAISSEMRDAIESAIAKLPDDYRAVFILRDIDGLSNKEVGSILDLTIPAVKSRLHRSRLMLRKRLKKFYEDYADNARIINYGPQLMRNAA